MNIKAVVHEHSFDLPSHSIDRSQRLVWALHAIEEKGGRLQLNRDLASSEQLAKVHARAYIDGIKALAELNAGWHLDPELIIGEWSYAAAAAAAGSLTTMTVEALSGEEEMIPFCLSRPGSHHAGSDYGMGLCIFNNLAVAAATALDQGLVERAVIIDFDAHHGNGTEEIFANESRVLTVSMHEYPFFPGSGAAGQEHAMSNLNLILAAGAGDDEACRKFSEGVRRILDFHPELILVEAGCDGHSQDWTTNLDYGDAAFRFFGDQIAMISDECDAPLVVEVGGGYTEAAVIQGLGAFMEGLRR